MAPCRRALWRTSNLRQPLPIFYAPSERFGPSQRGARSKGCLLALTSAELISTACAAINKKVAEAKAPFARISGSKVSERAARIRRR
jgi:hypothetical protein